MFDLGAKASFARSQMIFNVDVEVNFSNFLAEWMQSQSAPEMALDGKEGDIETELAKKKPKSVLDHMSGSFTFASVFEDFVSGSRINIQSSHASWTKLFMFSGPEFQPFYPNFNPSFSRLAALEYAKERELTSDCFSLSIRRRLGPVLSLIASSSWIAAQTLRGSHRHCWSLALVADDRRSGLEMLAGFNHVGNCCIGFKKDIGDSGVALRLSTVVLRAMECPTTDLKNCIEIGLEM